MGDIHVGHSCSQKVLFAPISCYVYTQAQGIYYKGWFKVQAKISVMALTPSPLSVIMTLIFKNSLEVSPYMLLVEAITTKINK